MTTLSILVLGAGELGMAVLRGLTSKRRPDTEITVLLRPETANVPRQSPKVAPIYALEGDVRILPVDLAVASQSELAKEFARFNVVIGCTGYANNEAGNTESLQMKLARAILEAGKVRLYVPWQFGVDYDLFERGAAGGLFDDQKDVRELLRAAVEQGETKTVWTIVSTGMFMSYLFQPWWGIVQKAEPGPGWVVNALGSWDHSVTVTTSEDIGTLTADIVFAALEEDEASRKLKNTAVYIAGDTITYAELVDAVAKATGQPARRGELLELPKLEEEMQSNPNEVLCKYRVAFSQSKGVAWSKSSTFNGERQIEVQNAQSWASSNLK